MPIMNVPPYRLRPRPVARMIPEKCQYSYSDQYSCADPATYVIVYGCPDFHITDVRYCGNHMLWFKQWIKGSAVFCPRCNVTIEDYEYGELNG